MIVDLSEDDQRVLQRALDCYYESIACGNHEGDPVDDSLAIPSLQTRIGGDPEWPPQE